MTRATEFKDTARHDKRIRSMGVGYHDGRMKEVGTSNTNRLSSALASPLQHYHAAEYHLDRTAQNSVDQNKQ